MNIILQKFHIKRGVFVLCAAGRLLMWNICTGGVEFCRQQLKKQNNEGLFSFWELVEDLKCFPITHSHTFIIFWWMCLSVDTVEEKPTDPNSAVMFSWLKWGCQCVWELHPCSISGLWAVVCSVCGSSVDFLLAFDSSHFSHCCLLAGCCSGLHVVL